MPHNPSRLLDRASFSRAFLERDGSCCVVCRDRGFVAATPLAAHHLLNRNLWTEPDHIDAEATRISADELRRMAGITSVLPYVKYPRTPHLPWSEGASEDDMVLPASSVFDGRSVVVTEKLDGESSSLYSDFYHARSLAHPSHPSQTRLKAFHASISHEFPPLCRVCVENCAAVHTISYNDLEALFPVISIWDDQNRCLSWSETEEWANLLGMRTVPVLYRGPWDMARVRSLYIPRRGSHDMGGYVVRLEAGFPYSQFRSSIAKFVSGRFRSALKDRDGVHWASAAVRWNRELASPERTLWGAGVYK